MFQAVIFDLDGTLLDSLEDLANAVNGMLISAGYPQHPLVAYRQFVGDGLDMLVRRALPSDVADSLTKEAFADLVRETADNYTRDWAIASRPYPQIPFLLKVLREKALPRAVVTNKPHVWTLRILEHFFADAGFTFVQGASPDIPRKPDPTSALQAARLMNVEPRHTVFLGDSNVDILTAKHAGMRAVGASWGFRGAEELKAAGAEILLDNPLDLLTLL